MSETGPSGIAPVDLALRCTGDYQEALKTFRKIREDHDEETAIAHLVVFLIRFPEGYNPNPKQVEEAAIAARLLGRYAVEEKW